MSLYKTNYPAHKFIEEDQIQLLDLNNVDNKRI